MRLVGLGGREFPPYLLLLEQRIWVSQDNIHWIEIPEAWIDVIPIMVLLQDPRVVLQYALNPQEVSLDLLEREGEEVPEQARVIEVRLDGKRFLEKYFHPPQFNPISDVESFLREYYIWLWIESATGRVVRMTLFGSSGPTRLAFTYDEPFHLEPPQEVLPFREAEALNRMTEDHLGVLARLIEGYRQKHGRCPETLMPETAREVLEVEQFTWPINPFTGKLMKEAKQSPGDYTYEFKADGQGCDLSGYGWDRPAGRYGFYPPPLFSPGMVVPPQVATPGAISYAPRK
ncbi:MAG TPA: hypothetical protein VGX03_27955 [Candidatus Binatia bacterium]|nr:hypothetical protein [Candidatus Binatia bacterium]